MCVFIRYSYIAYYVCHNFEDNTTRSLRVTLIILGYNFCYDDLLNKIFMSYNEPYNTFQFMYFWLASWGRHQF